MEKQTGKGEEKRLIWHSDRLKTNLAAKGAFGEIHWK